MMAGNFSCIFNMQNKGRPLSPHLTIYKPQISSVLSILHRITGVANFIGLSVLIWWFFLLTYKFDVVLESDFTQFMKSCFGISMLIAFTFSLFLHMFTGIRHLFWDMGKGFSIKAMTITGFFAVFSAFLMTGLTWFLIFSVIWG